MKTTNSLQKSFNDNNMFVEAKIKAKTKLLRYVINLVLLARPILLDSVVDRAPIISERDSPALRTFKPANMETKLNWGRGCLATCRYYCNGYILIART